MIMDDQNTINLNEIITLYLTQEGVQHLKRHCKFKYDKEIKECYGIYFNENTNELTLKLYELVNIFGKEAMYMENDQLFKFHRN